MCIYRYTHIQNQIQSFASNPLHDNSEEHLVYVRRLLRNFSTKKELPQHTSYALLSAKRNYVVLYHDKTTTTHYPTFVFEWRHYIFYVPRQNSHNTLPTPCFCMETLVRCTNMLSSSLTLALYFTVQKRQNPSRYLKIFNYMISNNWQ